MQSNCLQVTNDILYSNFGVSGTVMVSIVMIIQIISS